ncbi:MAG: NAD(P)H-hydrate epimerase, partial [Phycisphaerae bacterium]|nr:NAD(P)H-hydrate epimerase [Phycisphaerae bacterium]
VIIRGAGNNGGDGFVIARHLLNNNIGVKVIVCGQREKIKGDALVNLRILENIGQEIIYIDPKNQTDKVAQASSLVNKISTKTVELHLNKLIRNADFIVDALLGTGLTGDVKDSFKKVIEAINAAGCPVLAVDIPSGLDCDTGKPLGAAVQADYTVTFVAVKKGFTKPESEKYTGKVFVASIGVEPA